VKIDLRVLALRRCSSSKALRRFRGTCSGKRSTRGASDSSQAQANKFGVQASEARSREVWRVGKEIKTMAVIVDVYQDKRKTGNNLWYGRAWHPGILDDTRALAKRIEQNVSVKESDVYAVLIELANVMTYEIQNGNKCKLDRFDNFGG